MARIPNEILIMIFDMLVEDASNIEFFESQFLDCLDSRESLRKAMFVCRRWNQIVVPMFYQERVNWDRASWEEGQSEGGVGAGAQEGGMDEVAGRRPDRIWWPPGGRKTPDEPASIAGDC